MRFLQPGRTPADVERSEKASPAQAARPAVSLTGGSEARPEHVAAERADGHPRASEGLRILLERIDTLTSRLAACEESIRQMEQNESTLIEQHAASRRDLEERLRRLVERQVADLAGVTEQHQKAFAMKQAKLLELLASELSKVRSMAESAARPQPAGPTTRAEPQAPRRRTTDAGPDLDFFDGDGDDAGARKHGPAGRPDRARDEFEFWDWLESLPPEPGSKPVDDINLIDLDESELR